MGKILRTIIPVLLLLSLIPGCGKNGSEKNGPETNTQSIVRDSTVNVFSIDANKDGMVFQCPMKEHYNVISDISGICPLCKMELEETDINTADKNFDAKYHGKPMEEPED
jgi:hypothetical protein